MKTNSKKQNYKLLKQWAVGENIDNFIDEGNPDHKKRKSGYSKHLQRELADIHNHAEGTHPLIQSEDIILP